MTNGNLSRGQWRIIRHDAAQSTSSDYQMFLKMMTAQIRNQDPLNPWIPRPMPPNWPPLPGLSSRVRANQLLEGLSTQFSVLGMAQLAGWVGQHARADVPVAFDGSTPITNFTQSGIGRDRSRCLLSEMMMARSFRAKPFPVSSEPYLCLGADIAGNPLPAGTYGWSLKAMARDAPRDLAVESYATIIEAQAGPNGIRLLLAEGRVLTPHLSQPAPRLTWLAES